MCDGSGGGSTVSSSLWWRVEGGYDGVVHSTIQHQIVGGVRRVRGKFKTKARCSNAWPDNACAGRRTCGVKGCSRR
jgi:hypothetical protein